MPVRHSCRNNHLGEGIRQSHDLISGVSMLNGRTKTVVDILPDPDNTLALVELKKRNLFLQTEGPQYFPQANERQIHEPRDHPHDSLTKPDIPQRGNDSSSSIHSQIQPAKIERAVVQCIVEVDEMSLGILPQRPYFLKSIAWHVVENTKAEEEIATVL